MKTFKSIPTVNSSISYAASSNDARPTLNINSSAQHVVTDIRQIIPQLIMPDTTIDEALTIMQRSNNKTRLYVGTNSKLLGIISHSTLVSRNVLMIANQKGLARNDLTVADIMSLAYQMPAIAKENIQRACIGDITKTMQQLGEEHMQVVDEVHRVSGVISAADISYALQIDIDISITAHSFKDCFNVIHEHTELI